MIKMVFGHLADYAAEGASSKMNVIGIFDRVFVRDVTRQVSLPICYLAARLEASLMSGAGDHDLEVVFVDGNHEPVHPNHPKITIQFGAVGPGYPMAAQFIMMMGGLQIPEGAGDYAFSIRIDGKEVGVVPLIVAPAPTQ